MDNNQFNPHMDYLGLHALVCKFVKKEDEEKTNYNYTSQEIPSSPVAPLKPFEIIKLSKVYGDKSKRKPRKPISHCVFCKNNAESERVFTSHTLKDENMNITCPILRAYTCPICGSNGDTAHTIKYCPLNRGATF